VRGRRKIRVGEVVSNKMDKTVVVTIKREFTHPLYGKKVRRRKKLKAHDEANLCNVGDTVQLVETRPLSKEKCWKVARVLAKREK